MSEIPLVLSIMISLSEELEDRLANDEARLDAIRVDIAALEDTNARTRGYLNALYQELRTRAIGLGVLQKADGAPDDELAGVVDEIQEAFSENDVAAASDVVSLDSWRRSQAMTSRQTLDAADVVTESLEEALDHVLNSLTPEEQKVIRFTYGYGQPYEADELEGHQRWLQRVTAKALGISQPHVSRVLRKGLRKLNHPSRSRRLRPFADSIPRNGASRAQVILHAIFGEMPLT